MPRVYIYTYVPVCIPSLELPSVLVFLSQKSVVELGGVQGQTAGMIASMEGFSCEGRLNRLWRFCSERR